MSLSIKPSNTATLSEASLGLSAIARQQTQAGLTASESPITVSVDQPQETQARVNAYLQAINVTPGKMQETPRTLPMRSFRPCNR